MHFIGMQILVGGECASGCVRKLELSVCVHVCVCIGNMQICMCAWGQGLDFIFP